MTHQPTPATEIVRFQGVALERTSGQELATAKPSLLPVGNHQVYIAGDVMRSSYGAIGCLVVDTSPEQRWHSYTTDSERWITYYPNSPADLEAHAEEHLVRPEDCVPGNIDIHNPEHFARYIGTTGGFKLVRLLLLPTEVTRGIRAINRNMGPALIKDCVEGDNVADIIPNEEAMKDWPGIDESDLNHDNWQFGRKLELLTLDLKAALGLSSTEAHRYISFHGWPWYEKALRLGNRSIAQSLSNFDILLANFDRQRTIAQQRDLEAAAAEQGTVQELDA